MSHELALEKAGLQLFRTKMAGFFSTIYCNLEKKWSEDIPTACVDGRSLQVNPQWFLGLDEPTRVTVLAHEISHVALFHCSPSRCSGKNFRRWNVACDHVINLQLKEDGFVFNTSHLADPRFTDMSAEQVYQILEQEDSDDPSFSEDFVPSAHKDEELIKSVVASAVAVQEKIAPGSMSEVFASSLKAALYPTLRWEILLDQFLTEVSEQEETWDMPDRRFPDIYLPSMKDQNRGLGKILFAFDVSASVQESQIAQFMAESQSVYEKFSPELFKIITFNTGIVDEFTITDVSQLRQMEMQISGGTVIAEVIERTRQEAPDVLVVFSDMELWDTPVNPGVPVLWICLDNPEADKPPFGRMIHATS